MTGPPYPLLDDTVRCDSPVSDPSDAAPSVLPVEVAILYGDLEAGQRALRLVADLSVSLAGEVEFQPQLWRLSLLESPEIRDALADDFARAKIIILAPSEATVSADVRAWLEGSVEREAGEPSATVFMVMDCMGAAEASGRTWGPLKRPNGGELFVTKANRLSGYLPE